MLCGGDWIMANRYLVGNGNRNWNDVNNWSDSSGGAGGSSIPTLNDAVILDANSGTGVITIAGTDTSCASFDASAITAAITITSATVSLYNYGAWILDAQLTWTFTSTAYLYQKATSSVALTMNSATVNANRIYFDGVGGMWTNSDACNLGSSTIYLTNGTWDTNGKTITTTGSLITVPGTKTLTLGASTFNVGNWNMSSINLLTVNFNTSTINITSNSLIKANQTFYNLTLTGIAAITAEISFGESITVLNVLTITGSNTTNYRLLVASSVIGTQRTITAATIVASNVDFRDIKLAGACSKDLSTEALCPGLSGDCGGNTDIVFATARTSYFKKFASTASWKDENNWFKQADRASVSRVPLPQDTAILDANSFNQSCTLTIDMPRKGSVDMSGVSYAVTTVLANSVEHYGNLILGNNITPSGNYLRTLMGRGSYNLNLYGKSIYILYVKCVNGEYTFLSDLTTTGHITLIPFYIIRGTIYLNGFNVTTSYLAVSGTLYCSTGNITLTGDVTFNVFLCNGTIYSESSTIKLNPASGSANLSFEGGGKTYNKVWFSGTHTGYFDITGANTFAELVIDKGRKVRPVNGVTQNIAKLTAIGTQAEPITITSPTTAQHTLNTSATDIQADWLYLHYSKVTPAGKWFAGNGSSALPPMGNGLLYNWYAVAGIDGTTNDKQLAPAGCHIPTSTEWATLSTYLGGDTVSGGKLKSINSIFWTSNVGATNESGFYAFGNGVRSDGIFLVLGQRCNLWSSTESGIYAYKIKLINSDATTTIDNISIKERGCGVRCIVDTIPANGIITDVDGNRYGIVTIGIQTWLTSNLKTTKYADGTAIPNVTDNSAWAALTTGAYCSYNNAAIVEYPSNNDGWVMKYISIGMMNFF